MATTTEGRLASFSVRTRITVALFLLVALALGGTGALIYTLGTAGIQQEVPDAVDQEMLEFAELEKGIDPMTARPFASVERLIQVFLERNVPTTSELLVGYWDGRVQQRSVSPRSGLTRDPAFVAAITERLSNGGATRIQTQWGEVYVDVQPVRDDIGGGAFVVAYFVDDDRDLLNRTLRTYTIAAAIALCLVTAIAAWQAGRLLRPVRTLRETADEIGETDLSRRIPEVGNDDLTDLTRTLNAMLARLDNAFAVQRQFLDDAGHELRTPLTILRGHLELLDVDDADEVAHARELLLDEADRMSVLVDDLMLLAKAERPDFFTFTTVDVAELIDRVAEKTRALGDREWQVDERAQAHAVLDEQRITQALLQLAQNAAKHTRPGDTIALGSAMGPVDGTVRMWVRDTGPGVADEHKRVIFERFGRAEPAPGDAGFGLGLSIVSAIVEGHGGTVAVTDAVPAGAKFVIELPVRRRELPWPAS